MRWARGAQPATLYFSRLLDGVCLASEPLDGGRWREIPAGSMAVARPGAELRIEDLP